LFCLLIFSHLSLSGPNEKTTKGPEPSWVDTVSYDIPADLPLDQIEGGVYYVLLDNQVRVAKDEPRSVYSHYVQIIVNQAGLDRSSQISVEFDPVYKSLTFHTLSIIRDGKTINKLDAADITLIQREEDMDNLIYDGRLTANIILEDVRVGDIVDYGYTLYGDNPVYRGLFGYERQIEWAIPVNQQNVRVLWGKPTPLLVETLNTDLSVVEGQVQQFKEYRIETRTVEPRELNSETPGWYDPHGTVFFSEVDSWSEVARWAYPLYESAYQFDREVLDVAESIRIKHSDQSEQIAAALRFVQSEIRYLGIEMGVNSHTPSPALRTLSRRYGDCKDKAVLLVSILRALKIQAAPALVNTTRRQSLENIPPIIHAFNHVLVKVQLNGEVFWLDPTRQYQYESLSNIYQPAYRFALVVDKQTKNLEVMKTTPENSQLIVRDKYDLTQGGGKEVMFTSTSDYYGYEAEWQRYRLNRDGLSGIQKTFVEFYQKYYPSIEPIEKMLIDKESHDGSFKLTEQYRIDDFWEVDKNNGEYEASFYANSVSPYLVKPDQLARNSPYKISYPNNVEHSIEVLFGTDDWQFDNEEFVEDNPFFFYKSTVEFNKEKKTLNLIFEYQSRTDHVTVEDLDTYLKAVAKAKGSVEYPIVEYFKVNAGADKESVDEWVSKNDIFLYIVLCYLCLIVFVVINWRIDATKAPVFSEAAFYPVSLTKLFLLSVGTLGIYSIYWFYRNWLYLKNKNKKSISPLARGLFDFLWFYPFYRRLVDDSMSRFKNNRLPSKLIAVLMAAGYFVIAMISNAVESLLWLSIIVAPLFIFPLANYINSINESDARAYQYNSRWLMRHWLVVAILSPLLMVGVLSEVNLIPNEAVVDGKQLWKHDTQYMQRKGIYPAGENILYFYSDAFLDMREDGNGFTESSVFSYWKDDDGELIIATAALNNVKKIETTFSNNSDENTTISVVREDGSDFILYVSAVNRKDRNFVKLLKANWRLARANAGHAGAQYYLGMLERRRSLADERPKIINEWLEKSAGNGHAKASFEVALSLLAGFSGEVDKLRAMELIEYSASQEYARAELLLGELYSKGIHVVANSEHAIELLERAVEHGNKRAVNALAWHLATAGDQALRDPKKISMLLRTLRKRRDTVENLEAVAALFVAQGEFEKGSEAQQQAMDQYTGDLPDFGRDKLLRYRLGKRWVSPWSDLQQNRIEYFPIMKTAPQYPLAANREGVEGYATAEYDINIDGTVSNVRVIDTSDAGFFEDASIKAAKQFLYFPRVIDGEAVPVSGVQNRFTYELEK
jgi:TonB family protein